MSSFDYHLTTQVFKSVDFDLNELITSIKAIRRYKGRGNLTQKLINDLEEQEMGLTEEFTEIETKFFELDTRKEFSNGVDMEKLGTIQDCVNGLRKVAFGMALHYISWVLQEFEEEEEVERELVL